MGDGPSISSAPSEERLEIPTQEEMHKYEIIIYWSNEDALFIAEVPELPGCMAHGDTQEQALHHIKRGCRYGSGLPPVSSETLCPNQRESA